MSRSFLNSNRFGEAQERLRPPARTPNGDHRRAADFQSSEFSHWLLEEVLGTFREDASFAKAGPILLGSGARDELAPRSDLDFLFVGDEKEIAAFVRRAQENGLRLRSRTPQDLHDWTVGVEVPDIMAVWEGKPLSSDAGIALEEQKRKIQDSIVAQRKSWLKVLWQERLERETRHDSIANLLEPNIKYGPGGLRDLDQARQVTRLFPEKFKQAEHALGVMEYYARFWTLLRQKMHLEGHGDILMSGLQFDLARWFGMTHKDFMREVQRGLSRVHFYSHWIMERARSSEAQWTKIDALKVSGPAGAMRLLEKNPSILVQERVRRDLDSSFSDQWIEKKKERGRLLWQVLRPGARDEFVAAVFDSRVIDKLVPEIRPLVGYVQHDQYHRYTADVHLLQACRQYQRVLAKPRRLGVLAAEVSALSMTDRKILAWSVLYHDLMKGRDGDHSQEGCLLVRRDLKSFGVPSEAVKEVEWLVENHLILSQAAFRKNPLSPQTWSELKAAGAEKDRLRRLAVFTAVDILATNPEAWTPWKARLMVDLLKALRSPTALSYYGFSAEIKKAKLAIRAEELDGYLLGKIPAKVLAQDLKRISLDEKDHGVLLSQRDGELWLRIHVRKDRSGIFAETVQTLFSLGVGIKHAAIHTIDGVGVYNWFQVSSRGLPRLKVWAKNPVMVKTVPPVVKFESVSLVAEDETQWVFSFKGLDQPGCLAAAARALADEGLSLTSARVHTWGRQVDDLFHVSKKGNAEEILRRLQEKFK